MASSKKWDDQPAPGSAPEVSRLEQAQARDRRYVVPRVRAKAKGTRVAPRRGYKAEARASAPFRKPKAAPRVAAPVLGPVAQENLETRIAIAIRNIEARLKAESAARVAAVVYKPFRAAPSVRERLATYCNLA